jgi:hypothetical protein
MQKSDLFAYLAAFVSIVLAVALTDMIQSAHRLIRARARVKWDPLTPLFAVSVFLGLLSSFFSLWGDARFDRLTFYGLVAFMAQPTLTALVAFAVLPDEVPDAGLDLKRFYFENRRYLVVLLAISGILDIVWVMRWATMHQALGSSGFWWDFLPPATLSSLLLAIIYFSKNWRVQLAALVAQLLVSHLAFGGWYIDTVGTG